MDYSNLQVINNDSNQKRLTTDFLKDTSLFIKEKIGISLKLSIKDFNEGFEIDLNALKHANSPSSKITSYEETKKTNRRKNI